MLTPLAFAENKLTILNQDIKPLLYSENIVPLVKEISEPTPYNYPTGYNGLEPTTEPLKGYPKPIVKGIILLNASLFGISENLALDLAKWESRFDPSIENQDSIETTGVEKSTAGGLYQWTNGSWRTMCKGNKKDPNDNAYCTMKTISEGGISHWTADKRTRKKLLDKGYIDENNECTDKCFRL